MVSENKISSEMQSFFKVKTIAALPMTKYDFFKYMRSSVDKANEEDGIGYLVECDLEDGQFSNHKNHEGFLYWLPKESFEKTYTKCHAINPKNSVDVQGLLATARSLQDKKEDFGFSLALLLLEIGLKLRRRSWAPEKYIFLTRDSEYNIAELKQITNDEINKNFIVGNNENNIVVAGGFFMYDGNNYFTQITFSTDEITATDWEIYE